MTELELERSTSNLTEALARNMKRLSFVFLALSLFAAPTAGSLAQTLSLFGTLHSANGGGPIVGAKIYVQRGSSGRVGPALTDGYGRYAFYDISPGRYQLTVYVDDTKKWDVDVTVPGNVPPIVIP